MNRVPAPTVRLVARLDLIGESEVAFLLYLIIGVVASLGGGLVGGLFR